MAIGGVFCCCKSCTDRQTEPVNCHSYCEKYKQYREELEKARLNEKEEKARFNQCERYMYEQSRRKRR